MMFKIEILTPTSSPCSFVDHDINHDRDDETTQETAMPGTSEAADQSVETNPAVEWGERIATGKQIARGGKSEGGVPGAEASQS